MLYQVHYNEQIYYVRKARAGNVMQTSKCISLQIMN